MAVNTPIYIHMREISRHMWENHRRDVSEILIKHLGIAPPDHMIWVTRIEFTPHGGETPTPESEQMPGFYQAKVSFFLEPKP